MKFTFIEAEKTYLPIEFIYHRLKVSRSSHYAWRRQSISKHAEMDQ